MDDGRPSPYRRYRRPDPCRLHPHSGKDVHDALEQILAGTLPMDAPELEQLNNFALFRALGSRDGWFPITLNTNRIRCPPSSVRLTMYRVMVRLNAALLGRGWKKKDKARLVAQIARDPAHGFRHFHGYIHYGEFDGRADARQATLTTFQRYYPRGSVVVAERGDAEGWASYALGRKQRFSFTKRHEGLFLFV